MTFSTLVRGDTGYMIQLSLFQALGQWGRSNKRVGDERGLVEKKERSRDPVNCFKNLTPVYQLLVYPRIGYF